MTEFVDTLKTLSANVSGVKTIRSCNREVEVVGKDGSSILFQPSHNLLKWKFYGECGKKISGVESMDGNLWQDIVKDLIKGFFNKQVS